MKYIILILLGVVPAWSSAQFWRNTLTSVYQLQVEPLDTIEAPLYELNLPVTLPIIFHIVYPRDVQPPSAADIEWQVEQLNRHFSLEEFYTKQEIYGETDFDEFAADTEIEFCIKDIRFILSDSLFYSQFNTIKNNASLGGDAFFPKEHINVWVGRIKGSSGFSQLPGGRWETDGIVINMDFFGPRDQPYHEGKTLTHLMGNYLGLKDLWGNNNCEDDEVKDTPIHNAPNYNQVAVGERHISLCPGFEREMYMNYMDNTVDSTLYFFTKGQKERMHNFLQQERNGLLEGGCFRPLPRETNSSFPAHQVTHRLHAFPNPTTGEVNIRYQDEKGQSATLRIYNVLGEIMYQEQIGPIFNGEISIDTWQSGVYLISVSGSANYSLKLIKQ